MTAARGPQVDSPAAAPLAADSARLKQLVEQTVRRWQQGEPADASAVLARHPALAAQQSLVLELAYEEFCQRREAGQQVDRQQFCRRFPRCRHSLLRLLEVDEILQHDPELRLPAAPWPAPGDTYLEFRLIEELGRGALARVYLALEPALGNRRVALKVAASGPEEAKVLGRLDHPNVVPVFSVHRSASDGRTAICMPFLGRTTLADVLAALFAADRLPQSSREFWQTVGEYEHPGRLPQSPAPGLAASHFKGSYVDCILDIGAQLAGGLAYVHQQGILHGDLKPSNILIAFGGCPKLLDFNLAQSRQEVAHRFGGTIPYMAPEQLRAVVLGASQADRYDARADLYSLGLVLYESLAGRLPFGAEVLDDEPLQQARSLLERQQRGPEPLTAANFDVDGALARVVQACLAFDPDERPHSARALHDELRRQQSSLRRAYRLLRRRRFFAATLGTAGAACCGVLLSSDVLPTGTDDPQRQSVARTTAVPEAAWQLLSRARVHVADGRYAQAIQDLQLAARRGGEPLASVCEGYCHNLQNRTDLAIACYERAVKLGSPSAAALNNLACSLMLQSRHRQARQWLDAAVEKAPPLAIPRFNRARCEWQRMIEDKSYLPATGIDDIERAINLGESSGEAYRLAAILHCRAVELGREQPDRALTCFEKAVERGYPPGSTEAAEFLRPIAGQPRFRQVAAPPLHEAAQWYTAKRLLDPFAELGS